jgi:predicted RNA binding protein YcfA (HicA-like mRNA interferase family)
VCKVEEKIKKTVIIPMHEELAVWTLKSILIQADITLEKLTDTL